MSNWLLVIGYWGKKALSVERLALREVSRKKKALQCNANRNHSPFTIHHSSFHDGRIPS
jgi:hypothetical protein